MEKASRIYHHHLPLISFHDPSEFIQSLTVWQLLIFFFFGEWSMNSIFETFRDRTKCPTRMMSEHPETHFSPHYHGKSENLASMLSMFWMMFLFLSSIYFLQKICSCLWNLQFNFARIARFFPFALWIPKPPAHFDKVTVLQPIGCNFLFQVRVTPNKKIPVHFVLCIPNFCWHNLRLQLNKQVSLH